MNQDHLKKVVDNMIHHTERLRSISEELLRLSNSLHEAMKPIVDSLSDQSNAATKLEKSLKASFRNTKASSVPASELGDIPDFMRENWPLAIPPNCLLNTADQDLITKEKFRALQAAGYILDTVGLSTITSKRILDFGCGKGYITKEMAARSSGQSLVVGYDIDDELIKQCNTDHTPNIHRLRIRRFTPPHFDNQDETSLQFTIDKQVVESNGPYDLIYIYDVLDQLVGEDPIDVLEWIGSLITPDGFIFVRTHPWTSRHGGNIHETYNKAYLHLTMTADEFLKHDMDLPHNLKIVRPLAAYEKWVSESGLKIHHRNSITKKVEAFFEGPVLDRIIKINWAGSLSRDQALKIMSNEFIDFVLVK